MNDDHGGAATAASDKAGQQVLWAPVMRWLGSALLVPSGRSLCKECIRHDTKIQRIVYNPLVRRIRSGLTLARCRVLHEALPVVDDLADVELVIDQAVRPLATADDCRDVPRTATRRRRALTVQVRDDIDRLPTPNVLLKNSLHDCGFGLVDCSLPALVERRDEVVAIRLSARDAAGFHAPDLAASRLQRQVIEKHTGNHAFETDVHLAHGAIGKRDDFNAGVFEALVNAGNVLEVAGKPVERFR
nr:hypothetical protein [Hyphomicrobium denitrificans]